MSKTLYEKIWENHCIESTEIEDILYIDLHLLHEVNTSPCFQNMENKKREVSRPELTLATADHNVSTTEKLLEKSDDVRKTNIIALRDNCEKNNICFQNIGDENHGITHVIAPEQGLIIPGSTVACCDSHTTTHGAFGALGFGIGSSQVEHVLTTQTLRICKLKTMKIEITNNLSCGVSTKDLALYIINKIGTSGGFGHVIEYTGNCIKTLSMEARMTLCNMSVEAGAGAALIGVDNVTIDYLRRIYLPVLKSNFYAEEKSWREFVSDSDAVFDKEIRIDALKIKKIVTWGTNPAQSMTFKDNLTNLDDKNISFYKEGVNSAYRYMGLKGNERLEDINIDYAFIGSCTNGRIEDLRIAANILKGKKVNEEVKLVIVPGSMAVLKQAIGEGLDLIFKEAGADFRYLSGCSMCVGLNTDTPEPGTRCISTSNRNFEGRQGIGVRTHIASPDVVAYSSILGHISNPILQRGENNECK